MRIRIFMDDSCLYMDLCDEPSLVGANAGVRAPLCVGTQVSSSPYPNVSAQYGVHFGWTISERNRLFGRFGR